MPFVSITRLRIRSIRFLPAFALHAYRTAAQVRRADGFVTGSLMPDRKWTFWTMTAWRDRADMRRYIASGDHLAAMPKLLGWCNEASIVHWQQDTADLPDWPEADRRMRAESRPSKVRHPTPAHAALRYDPPRTTRTTPLRRR